MKEVGDAVKVFDDFGIHKYNSSVVMTITAPRGRLELRDRPYGKHVPWNGTESTSIYNHQGRLGKAIRAFVEQHRE